VNELSRDGPWQLLLTGDGIGQLDAAMRRALERILELFTEVGGLVVHTVAGQVSVTRDFPSDYTLLKDIFTNNADVTGIEFSGPQGCPGHTATPDDPHWLADGKAYASIETAVARGDMTTADAIAAYLRPPQRPPDRYVATSVTGSSRSYSFFTTA
jgi:hypothetical protein